MLTTKGRMTEIPVSYLNSRRTRRQRDKNYHFRMKQKIIHQWAMTFVLFSYFLVSWSDVTYYLASISWAQKRLSQWTMEEDVHNFFFANHHWQPVVVAGCLSDEITSTWCQVHSHLSSEDTFEWRSSIEMIKLPKSDMITIKFHASACSAQPQNLLASAEMR